MDVIMGKEMTLEIIKGWVEIVNAEFGLSDRNEASINYFMRMKDWMIFINDPVMYAVLEPDFDMWGNKELYVVSFYIKPEHRNIRNLIKLQRKIEEIARAFEIKMIIQGSHLGDRLFMYLERNGYKVATMRKEL